MAMTDTVSRQRPIRLSLWLRQPPALAQLQMAPIVVHVFAFYDRVLADITSPVTLAAYAAAGFAGSSPTAPAQGFPAGHR